MNNSELLAKLLIIILIIYFFRKNIWKIGKYFKPRKKHQYKPEVITNLNEKDNEEEIVIENKINKFDKSYQPRYLLTINEKQQFKKLKAWASTHNAIVFTKVRVLDLIEPRKGINNYKTLFYKIQAKHVDFVICDQEIKVKCIIELDDNSHNNKIREERDNFLHEALSGAGYRVLHTRYITPEFLNQI